MPRAKRNATGGVIYHVINRANGQFRIFKGVVCEIGLAYGRIF